MTPAVRHIPPRRRAFDFEPWHYDYRTPRTDRRWAVLSDAVRDATAQAVLHREALEYGTSYTLVLPGKDPAAVTYPTVSPTLIPLDRKAPTMGNLCSCGNRFCFFSYASDPRVVVFAPASVPAPEFDKRLTNGAKVRLKHKTRDEVIEFTAAVVIRNGGRIIGVRASSTGPRYNAADGYTLTILAPALPATAGLYTPKRANGSHLVYRLKRGGGWLRWDTAKDTMETTTAYSVGQEVGPEGLIPLKADRAA